MSLAPHPQPIAHPVAAAQTELPHRLSRSLARHAPLLAGCALERLRDKGLAHDHVRLVGSAALTGTPLLARVPKQSQLDLPAADNLAYQAACFDRACAGGHAPRLHAVLPPDDLLPRGALLVEDVHGRVARLPGDLHAIMAALAALHRLPVPAPGHRAPLIDMADPLAALADEIAVQAAHVPQAALASAVSAAISAGIASLRSLCAGPHRPPARLIAFDGHPGNFIVRPDGRAVLVDLEKCRYSYPGLDLAHATLYTSTTWDLDSHAVLDGGQVHRAYLAWESAVGEPLATQARPWHGPLRRAMWLWSLTWCAKWRVLSGQPAQPRPSGEDWSASHSDAALVRHVRDRVDHYLDAAVVARVLQEFDELDLLLHQ